MRQHRFTRECVAILSVQGRNIYATTLQDYLYFVFFQQVLFEGLEHLLTV